MAAKQRKVIITCAVTGSIHTPTMSPHLPLTPDEVATDAIAAAEAGAAILHLHARDPKDGRPTPSPDVFMEFLPRIKQASNAVVNITTGGGHGMTLAERLAAPLRAKPEMCSLNMGSMNFGLYPMLDRYKEFKHEWERKHLENSRDFIFRNTFKDIEEVLKTLGEGHGVKFEFECYDVGHLYTLAHFVERGLIKPPFFVQTIFGILGGIGPDLENVDHMKRIADKLFGEDYYWSILAAGRFQMPFLTHAATMGANVRVGLEDSLWLGRGKLAKSNADQVAKIRRIIEELSMEIATPDEARQMLALKGGDAVGF
ncbi:MAG: 3-keto-5-aminohexanoate cleavage protein [Alphaproteobacteria bacterium]|nr:3-keto-5-aminohexanoate cleavage protein [Alphaproteobacteria bacterium]